MIWQHVVTLLSLSCSLLTSAQHWIDWRLLHITALLRAPAGSHVIVTLDWLSVYITWSGQTPCAPLCYWSLWHRQQVLSIREIPIKLSTVERNYFTPKFANFLFQHVNFTVTHWIFFHAARVSMILVTQYSPNCRPESVAVPFVNSRENMFLHGRFYMTVNWAELRLFGGHVHIQRTE